MPQSMTGYGAAEKTDGDITVRVEARSVNHRHLDARFRPSTGVPALENKLIGRLREHVSRGHIDVRVTVRALAAASALTVDLQRARAYHDALGQIGAMLKLPVTVTCVDVAGQPGVIESAPSHQLLKANKELAIATFDDAVADLINTRLGEGERLAADLRGRVEALTQITSSISALTDGIMEQRRESIRERVEAAVRAVGASTDSGRLEQELVHIVDRMDVTEEIVRLRGHLDAFGSALADESSPGRKLGFLAQEILREFNTIGSKSSTLAITEYVVAAKVEVEKLREQVLNLE